MIEANKVRKKFGKTVALERVSLDIPTGSIYGLIGSNGAGKSTLLRMFAGILRPDRGTVTLDTQTVYEQPLVKQRCFTVSDEQYYFLGATPREMMRFYKKLYPNFQEKRWHTLMEQFRLSETKRLRSFSKGMRRQAALIAGVSAGVDYLFCDEAFDGLDPTARQAIKSVLIGDVAEREMTVVITSHNMQELENFCDRIGVLHQGHLLFSRYLDDVKEQIQKIQYVGGEQTPEMEHLLNGFDIIKKESRGQLNMVVVRGGSREVDARMRRAEPIYYERIPLTLEEIFLTEMEENGYDPSEIDV